MPEISPRTYARVLTTDAAGVVRYGDHARPAGGRGGSSIPALADQTRTTAPIGLEGMNEE
jgi:hypothetical protein